VGSFQETVQGIKNLAALHQSCNCRIVISKSNIALLGEILAFLVGIGIKNIDFTFPHIQGNARRYGDAVVPMYSEIQPLLKRVFHMGRKYSVRTSFSGIPVCFMYGFEDCASAYYRSKAGKKELRQLDGKVMDMAVLKNSMYCKHAKCLDCPYEIICPGVRREYIELFGASEFR
jgi:sulfatase maturation enzyme AslB (radical SAM superfamily)